VPVAAPASVPAPAIRGRRDAAGCISSIQALAKNQAVTNGALSLVTQFGSLKCNTTLAAGPIDDGYAGLVDVLGATCDGFEGKSSGPGASAYGKCINIIAQLDTLILTKISCEISLDDPLLAGVEPTFKGYCLSKTPGAPPPQDPCLPNTLAGECQSAGCQWTARGDISFSTSSLNAANALTEELACAGSSSKAGDPCLVEYMRAMNVNATIIPDSCTTQTSDPKAHCTCINDNVFVTGCGSVLNTGLQGLVWSLPPFVRIAVDRYHLVDELNAVEKQFDGLCAKQGVPFAGGGAKPITPTEAPAPDKGFLKTTTGKVVIAAAALAVLAIVAVALNKGFKSSSDAHAYSALATAETRGSQRAAPESAPAPRQNVYEDEE